MRKILLSLVFTAWMGLAWAATPKRVVLQVENMTCPACSITIEKALDTVPGVTAKRIDTQAATVTVAFDAERTNAAAIDRFRSECDQPEVPANARPPSGSRLTAASGRSGTRPGPRTDPGTLPARPKAQRHPVASRLARDARGFPPAVPSGRGLAGHDLVGRVGVPARQHRARAAGNDALQRARRGLHGFRRHHAWIRRDSVVACGRAACRRGDPAGRALARK